MNNPFEFMQQFMNQENFTKNFNFSPEMMKNMPNVDWSDFSNMVKKNAEALSAANQMAAESFQSIAKRSSDSVQKNTTEMFNSMKDAVAAGDMQQLSSSGQKYLKNSLQTNINNSKEILDVASKSSMEILEVVGKSMNENINSAFKKTKSKS